MRGAVNPEIRAAEIVAEIIDNYALGGWFACMTPGEQAGWNLHEWEWWTGDYLAITAPQNTREWAGWLAREIWVQQSVAPLSPGLCIASGSCGAT